MSCCFTLILLLHVILNNCMSEECIYALVALNNRKKKKDVDTNDSIHV